MRARVKAFCEYDLMSDAEGIPWMTETLGGAVGEGKLDEVKVYDSLEGKWGVQRVLFSVTVTPDQAGVDFPDSATWEEWTERIETLLNGPVVPASLKPKVTWIGAVE